MTGENSPLQMKKSSFIHFKSLGTTTGARSLAHVDSSAPNKLEN